MASNRDPRRLVEAYSDTTSDESNTETEVESSQLSVVPKKRKNTKLTCNLKKRNRIIVDSSTSDDTDKGEVVDNIPNQNAKGGDNKTITLADDTINTSIENEFANKTDDDFVGGGQRMTPEDLRLIEDELGSQTLFNQAICHESTRHSDTPLETNAYILSEHTKRKLQFKGSSLHKVLNTRFTTANNLECYTITNPGIMSHTIKVMTDGNIPTKINLCEKYQSVKNVSQIKMEFHPTEYPKVVEAVCAVINSQDSSNLVATHKRIKLEKFGGSEVFVQMSPQHKQLTIAQTFPEAARSIENKYLEINPRIHLIKTACTLKIPFSEQRQLVESLKETYHFHDFLLQAHQISIDVLTDVSDHFKKIGRDNTGFTHMAKDVYNYTIFKYHTITAGLKKEYPIDAVLNWYLQKHMGKSYAYDF